MHRLTVPHRFLWIPVQTAGEQKRIELFDESGKKRFSFLVPILPSEKQPSQPDFYGSLPVPDDCRTLNLEGDVPEAWIFLVQSRPDMPNPVEEPRPYIHFTPVSGWLNDPNGLIYSDGVFHLYFQANPFHTEWENMHWGHAISYDLLHWEQKEPVLFPDETGAMFSGSAIQDHANDAGYGNGSLLYFYTAAGNTSEWSQGKPYVQMLAASGDGGNVLQKTGLVLLSCLAEGNRDPKVFYHAPSNGYVMVLYLSQNDFGIFRSRDLRQWVQTQTLTLPGAWECPDLFFLPLDGSLENGKWVFWSADGFYYIGSFNGYAFTPESTRKNAYLGHLPYAAQTYAGMGNRVISIAWLRTKNQNRTYRGIMSLPSELSLLSSTEGPVLSLSLPKEITGQRILQSTKELPSGRLHLEPAKEPAEYLFSIPRTTGYFSITMQNKSVLLDFYQNTLQTGEISVPLPHTDFIDLSIVADTGILELRACRNTLYDAVETPVNCNTPLFLEMGGAGTSLHIFHYPAKER